MKYLLDTPEVAVGNLIIGGNHPVVIQSMTNTDTLDTEATVAQCKRLFDCGCQMVRITAPGMKEAQNLENIKNALRQSGYEGPLVADIHFLPEAALLSAQIVEKVRINPGNYCDRKTGKTSFSPEEQQAERERIAQRIAPLLEVCKKNHTAIRIGVNQGSLSERMINLYGNTPLAMVKSAMEFIGICEEQDFRQFVISMKSSRVQTMNTSVRMLVEQMRESGHIYPLHLGVTEAGDGEDARLASAIGIGSLLKDGIGHTIRVSLTEDPEKEIPVALDIIKAAEKLQGEPKQKSTGLSWKIPDLSREIPGNDVSAGCTVSGNTSHTNSWEYDKIEAAIALGSRMLQGIKDGYSISSPIYPQEQCQELLDNIYQAAGIRFHKTRFIACPSCGRTKYDIQAALAQVKARFPNYPNLTLAVMGCIVNGPGEMADADFGYIGCGGGKVNLYHQGQLVKTSVPEEEALGELEKLIGERWGK